MDHLALYSRNCKKCSYLDPGEDQKFDKCHFSSGNTECPAKEVQLAIVGMAKRFAIAVKKARRESNLTKEAEILEAVAKRSPAFQQRFKEWLAR